MKKRNIIVIVSIVITLPIMMIYIIKNEDDTFKSNGVTYALTVNGKSQNSFPAKGLYKVTTNCTNAIGKWDYEAWKLYIKNATGNVSCDISFDTLTKIYLNDHVKGLVSTTASNTDWKVVNEPTTDYRYEGKNPNNWVWFNNELWRIIGVFDTNTHAQSDDTSTTQKENLLVKIIRSNSIGALAWNKSGGNDWANSSLYKLLNPVSGDIASGVYYNRQNGNGNVYCYSYSTSAPGNCDYSNIGIDSNYKSMIENVVWKLGGCNSSSITAATFYEAERGSETGNNNEYAKEIMGYVGLMYASDYGYSVLEKFCPRTLNLNSYGSSCMGQSWLAGNAQENLLSIDSSRSYFIFTKNIRGKLTDGDNQYNGFQVRPTLYLDSSVYVIDGTGTEADPYIVGM